MVINEADVAHWLSQAYWPFLRLTGLFVTSPFLGNSMIPVRVRVALCLLLTAWLCSWLPQLPPMPATTAGILLLGGVQVACGAALGLIAQMIVAAVAGAGEMAGFAIGTSFATLTMLAIESSAPVLYDIYYWAGILTYMAIGGPAWAIQAVATTFTAMPSGELPHWALRSIFLFVGKMFEGGVILAMPALAASLCLNVVLGLANALAPQLNIFSLGFPMLLLGGTWIVSLTLGDIGPAMQHLLVSGAALWNHVLGGGR